MKSTAARWVGLGLWAIYAAVIVRGAAETPFHPDESTYIFMSHDVDVIIDERQPARLCWRPELSGDPAMRYRLLDPPLGRYLIGLSRKLAGYAALPADWNWSLNWDENVRVGALPAPDLLFAARLPAAMLTALSALLIFRVGRQVNGNLCGLIAASLYALNALVLLHGRRAMSEGPLLFTALLSLWWTMRYPHRPALLGLGAALAVAAKHTNLIVLALTVLALAALSPSPAGLLERSRACAICLTTFAAITFVLNPVLWASPLAAVPAMVRERLTLHARQIAVIDSLAPAYRLESPGERALVLMCQVYFAPFAFWDVPNYAEQTRPAERRYLSNPLNHLLRQPELRANLVGGGLELALTIAGITMGVLTLFRHHSRRRSPPPAGRSSPMAGEKIGAVRPLALLLTWTILTAGGLLVIDINMQRYYMPLLPISALWIAYTATVWRQFSQSASAASSSAARALSGSASSTSL